MSNNTNVSINRSELKSAISSIEEAYKHINYIMTVLPNNFFSQKMTSAFRASKDVINKEKIMLQEISSNVDAYDESNFAQNTGSDGVTALYVPQTGVATVVTAVPETGRRPVVEEVLTPVVVPVNTENTGARVEPLNDTIEEATEQLNRALKDGDLKAAMVSYKILKSLGFERQARAALKRNGYKITTVNGEEVIVRINESGSTTNTTPSTNTGTNTQNPTEPTNNPSNEVVAEEVKPTNNNVSNVSSNNQRQNVVHTNNTTSNNQASANNTPVENNASTASTSPSTSTTATSTNTTKPTSIKPNKSNVVSITEDTTPTKKSSGVGTAVGLGLGTIAAGAAAVAGVRYVKNRNSNKEEYDDENYDDENNHLDDENEYTDSAQYSSGSDYMDDNYLGPAGSNYTDVDSDSVENDYVDPEELEPDTSDNLSSDIVLDQLNLNN